MLAVKRPMVQALLCRSGRVAVAQVVCWVSRRQQLVSTCRGHGSKVSHEHPAVRSAALLPTHHTGRVLAAGAPRRGGALPGLLTRGAGRAAPHPLLTRAFVSRGPCAMFCAFHTLTARACATCMCHVGWAMFCLCRLPCIGFRSLPSVCVVCRVSVFVVCHISLL